MIEVIPHIEQVYSRFVNTQTKLRDGTLETDITEPRLANAISRLITGSNSNIRINYGSESRVYTIRDFDEKSLRDYIIKRVALGINDFSRILAETSIDIINEETIMNGYPMTLDEIEYVLEGYPVKEIRESYSPYHFIIEFNDYIIDDLNNIYYDMWINVIINHIDGIMRKIGLYNLFNESANIYRSLSNIGHIIKY